MSATRIADPTRWLPAALLAALERAGAGHRIHLVGGAIRDRWLGRAAPDLDLVADGAAAQLGRRLAAELGGRFVDLAGERFASYRIVAGELVVDLWGRGGAPIAADLERRDLTINALAIDLESGELLDPFGGAGDLDRRRLRATTRGSFDDDPLRVLRLARFAATLEGFRVDPPTLRLARRAAPGIAGVAGERIRDEVARTLAAGGRDRGLEVLAAAGVYPALWDGREPGGGETVGERLAAIEPAHQRLVAGLAADLYDLDPIAVAQALLFSPPGGGPQAARRSRLLGRRLRHSVGELLAIDALPAGEQDCRRFLRRWRRRWCEAAVFAMLRPAAKATAAERGRRLSELAARDGRRIFDLPALLDGDEVARLLGLEPGPAIGRALAALEDEQVLGRVETAAEARAFLARLRRGG